MVFVFNRKNEELIQSYLKEIADIITRGDYRCFSSDGNGQWKIHKTGYGMVGMITNHSYLDNPTFRGMRQSLINTFDETYILDLHGNSLKKETCPDGSADQNVFDIRQGVAIALFVKNKPCESLELPQGSKMCKVVYTDLWGNRNPKYE